MTLGSPRSIARKVLRVIPARSATMVAENLRLSLARRIFSPNEARSLCKEGSNILFFLAIMINTHIYNKLFGLSINHYSPSASFYQSWVSLKRITAAYCVLPQGSLITIICNEGALCIAGRHYGCYSEKKPSRVSSAGLFKSNNKRYTTIYLHVA